MARIRIAEVVVVAALAGSLAACGGSSGKPAAAPVTVTSTVQVAPPSSATTTAASSSAGTSATSATTASSAQPSKPATAGGSSTAATGGGVADAGDKMAIVGTLQYLAPGKYIVHPDDGSTDQAFYVADNTQILGAAAICGDPNGNVTIGGDGYGTTKCTGAELETAAKTNAVKVRIVMERKTGNVLTVEEKYHP